MPSRNVTPQMPELAQRAPQSLVDQLRLFDEEVNRLEAGILEWHRARDVSHRLAAIPSIGSITASLIAAVVSDGTLFRSGRQFAAWLWLTPKAHSSGGKDRQVDIGEQGEGYLRRLLVAGATAIAAGSPRPRGLLLCGEATGAQASQTCRHSLDQQDRQHRMGSVQARRDLPRQRLSGKSEIIRKCRTKPLRSTSSWKMISGVLPSTGHPGSACGSRDTSSPAQGRRTGETEDSPPLGSQPAGHQSCKPRWTQGASPTLRRGSARLADWDLKTSRAIKGLRIDHRSAGTSAEFRTLLWKSAERPRG